MPPTSEVRRGIPESREEASFCDVCHSGLRVVLVPVALAPYQVSAPRSRHEPVGVVAAAFITAGLIGGGAGAKELLARLIRFRVHPAWYAFALGFPVVVAVIALGISVLFGAKLDAPFRLPPLLL